MEKKEEEEVVITSEGKAEERLRVENSNGNRCMESYKRM